MEIDASLLYSARGFDGEIRALFETVLSQVKELKERTFVGTSDDGRIEAIVGAAGDLKSISIHILSKRHNDNQTLSDLVLEAIKNAQEEAAAAQQRITTDLKVFGVPVSQALERHQEIIQGLRPSDWGL